MKLFFNLMGLVKLFARGLRNNILYTNIYEYLVDVIHLSENLILVSANQK